MKKIEKMPSERGQRFYYINTETGEKSIEFVQCFPFYEGFGIIENEDGKQAYIDESFKIVSKWYNKCNDYNSFPRVITENDKWLLLSKDFEEVIGEYDYIDYFWSKNQELTEAQKGDKRIKIDRNGKEVGEWFTISI